jgi:hypothetical protein
LKLVDRRSAGQVSSYTCCRFTFDNCQCHLSLHALCFAVWSLWHDAVLCTLSLMLTFLRFMLIFKLHTTYAYMLTGSSTTMNLDCSSRMIHALLRSISSSCRGKEYSSSSSSVHYRMSTLSSEHRVSALLNLTVPVIALLCMLHSVLHAHLLSCCVDTCTIIHSVCQAISSCI